MEAHFGEMLRILRTKQGLSQHQLANKLHVDRATISNWEADRRLPDVDTLSNLAKALGVDVSVLLVSAEEGILFELNPGICLGRTRPFCAKLVGVTGIDAS